MLKKEKSIDYFVIPLEGLWWVNNMSKFCLENMNKYRRKRILMIMQPEYVTKDIRYI